MKALCYVWPALGGYPTIKGQCQMKMTDLQPYGDLLSTCGALLIFFSWLATNTLGERFKKAQTAYETARDKRHLYHRLNEIEGSNRSVAAEVINVDREVQRLAAQLDPQRDKQAVRDWHEYIELHLGIGSTAINAGQIDRANSSLSIDLDQPGPNAKPSLPHKQLLESRAKIKSLLAEKNTVVAQMWANLARHGEVSLEDVRKEDRRLQDAYKAILQLFRPLLKAAVDAINAEQDELRREYSKAKGRSTKAEQVSIYLYIVGTALVLLGTVLDKLVK
jgi:hypothetical protein